MLPCQPPCQPPRRPPHRLPCQLPWPSAGATWLQIARDCFILASSILMSVDLLNFKLRNSVIITPLNLIATYCLLNKSLIVCWPKQSRSKKKQCEILPCQSSHPSCVILSALVLSARMQENSQVVLCTCVALVFLLSIINYHKSHN